MKTCEWTSHSCLPISKDTDFEGELNCSRIPSPECHCVVLFPPHWQLFVIAPPSLHHQRTMLDSQGNPSFSHCPGHGHHHDHDAFSDMRSLSAGVFSFVALLNRSSLSLELHTTQIRSINSVRSLCPLPSLLAKNRNVNWIFGC